MAVHIGTDIAVGTRPRPFSGTAARPWYLGTSAFAQALVGFWRLDESAGNALAGVGATAFTANGSPGSGVGVDYELARSFNGTNQFFSILDSATVSSGDIDMFAFCKFAPTSIAQSGCIYGKFNTTANREWQLVQSNADLALQVSSTGAAGTVVTVPLTGVLKAGVFHTVVWYHDSVNNLLGISLNGSEFGTVAHTAGIFNSASALTVAREGGAAGFWNGRVQSVGLGKGYIPTVMDADSYHNRDRQNGVANMHFIGYGGEPNWSADGTRIVYNRKDGDPDSTAGDYQLYTANPDGSGEVCITTTQVSGGPATDRHKGFAAWHPSGDWIVASVEQASHPGVHSGAEPGRGVGCTVGVFSADGSQYTEVVTLSQALPNGVLQPRFNHAGDKLMWAERSANAAGDDLFGTWVLKVGDFAIVNGVPTVSNTTTVDTAGNFYESHGFSRDDSRLLFTSDVAANHAYALDIMTSDLDGGNLVNVTNSATAWDEHGEWAAHGDVISWMSSLPYPSYVPANGVIDGLRGELFVSKPDGSERKQITHFNRVGFSEYDSEFCVPTVPAWSPDGRRLIFAQLMLGTNYDKPLGRRLWMVEFNGVYT